MSLPAWVHTAGNAAVLHLKVQPRARRNEVGSAVNGELKVKVTAPPVDSAANEAVLQLLAEALGCRRGDLRLVRGHASRSKIVEVRGLTAAEVVDRLHPTG